MVEMNKYVFTIILSIVFLSCEQDFRGSQEANHRPLFTQISESTSNLHFQNKIEDKADQNIALYDYFYNGGGVAIGDINNDGLSDLLFTGNQESNKLYKNLGDFQFEDISFEAGIEDNDLWSTGATFVDINQDGWLDIYICHSGLRSAYSHPQNHLYINDKNGKFIESAADYGLNDENYSSQSAFFDYDLDGDLDLFVMNHSDFINRFQKLNSFLKRQEAIREYTAEPENLKLSANILFENKGDGKFEDVTDIAGLRYWGYGLGLKISDMNGDNLPDIYVANDYYVPDFVFYNNGDKTFSESNNTHFGHNSQFSMGCDVADIDNDGYPDISVVDMTSSDRVRNKTLMRPMNEQKFIQMTQRLGMQYQYMFNVLQHNNGNGHFSEIGQLVNNSLTDWSWTTLLVDFDLDGNKDNFISNGYLRDTKNRMSSPR